MEILASVHKLLDSFELSDNYRGKAYVRNFNDHVDSLFETCSVIYEITPSASTEFNFTNSLYWECEALVLEKLDDVTDRAVLNNLDNLEDKLYSILVSSLGAFYRNGDRDWINKMLDMTIGNLLLGIKFENFSQSKYYQNPWIDAMDILLENKLIYTFSDDVTELKDLGLKVDRKESDLVSDKFVGVAGKGNKRDFATGYFRDLTALRNTVYNLLEAHNDNSSRPLKKEDIVKEIRFMGIKEEELTNNNIQNWLINPLKRSNRIGSNKDGYFAIKNADDLIVSYNSHFENFKGFYRTLERHRRFAKHFDIPDDFLNKHNLFLKDVDTDKD